MIGRFAMDPIKMVAAVEGEERGAARMNLSLLITLILISDCSAAISDAISLPNLERRQAERGGPFGSVANPVAYEGDDPLGQVERRVHERRIDLMRRCKSTPPVTQEDLDFNREVHRLRRMIKRGAVHERRAARRWKIILPPSMVNSYLHYLEWQDHWLTNIMRGLKGAWRRYQRIKPTVVVASQGNERITQRRAVVIRRKPGVVRKIEGAVVATPTVTTRKVVVVSGGLGTKKVVRVTKQVSVVKRTVNVNSLD